MTGPWFEDRRAACLSDFTSAIGHARNAVVAVAARTDRDGVVLDYELSVTLVGDDVRKTMQEPPHKEQQRRGRGR